MSLYTFAMWPEQAIVAADTRMCTVIDGKAYRQNDTTFKLHVIDDTVITCGGASWLCTYILQRWMQDEDHHVERLHKIALESIRDLDHLSSVLDPTGALAEHSRGTDYLLEILALQFDKALGHNILYQISSYNDYRLVRHNITNPSCTMAYGGIDQQIVQKYFNTHDHSTFDKYIASLVPAYREAASEKVGGFLSVAVQEHGKVTFAPLWAKIPDTRRIAECPPTASPIMSRNIIGKSLILESEGDNSEVKRFRFDSTGAWLNNATFTLQSDKGGEMLLHPDYGILAGKDIYTVKGTTVKPICYDEDGKIILDKDGFPQNANFYIDPKDGSAYFRGTVIAKDGTFSGKLSGATGDFSGSVTAYDFKYNDGTSLKTLIDQAGNVDLSDMTKIDLGLIVLDGEEGKIYFKTPPITYQYSVNGTSGWHDTMTNSDKYRRESYDGGNTWRSVYQFRGTDGSPGQNGSDASVTYANIKKALQDASSISSAYLTMDEVGALILKGGEIYGGKIYAGDGSTNLYALMGDKGLSVRSSSGSDRIAIYPTNSTQKGERSVSSGEDGAIGSAGDLYLYAAGYGSGGNIYANGYPVLTTNSTIHAVFA